MYSRRFFFLFYIVTIARSSFCILNTRNRGHRIFFSVQKVLCPAVLKVATRKQPLSPFSIQVRRVVKLDLGKQNSRTGLMLSRNGSVERETFREIPSAWNMYGGSLP